MGSPPDNLKLLLINPKRESEVIEVLNVRQISLITLKFVGLIKSKLLVLFGKFAHGLPMWVNLRPSRTILDFVLQISCVQNLKGVY